MIRLVDGKPSLFEAPDHERSDFSVVFNDQSSDHAKPNIGWPLILQTIEIESRHSCKSKTEKN